MQKGCKINLRGLYLLLHFFEIPNNFPSSGLSSVKEEKRERIFGQNQVDRRHDEDTVFNVDPFNEAAAS